MLIKYPKNVCYISSSIVIIGTIDIHYCARSEVVILLHKIIENE